MPETQTPKRKPQVKEDTRGPADERVADALIWEVQKVFQSWISGASATDLYLLQEAMLLAEANAAPLADQVLKLLDIEVPTETEAALCVKS